MGGKEQSHGGEWGGMRRAIYHKVINIKPIIGNFQRYLLNEVSTHQTHYSTDSVQRVTISRFRITGANLAQNKF